MHSLVLAAFLAASSAVAAPTAAAPAAYPTPTFTCAKGLVPQLAHFDDLTPVANGTRAHTVNPKGKPANNVYKNLYYGTTDWYIISNGYMTVPWNDSPTEVAVEGEMTVHSGRNAIIETEHVPFPVAVMYGGDYFNLKSLWVRSHSAAAFTMEIRCFVLNNKGTTTPQEVDVNVPAVPTNVNGGYYKIQLTPAQQGLLAKSRECLFGDKNQTSFTLMDDLEYCYYKKPGNPY